MACPRGNGVGVVGSLIFEVRPADPIQNSSALSPDMCILVPRSRWDGVGVAENWDMLRLSVIQLFSRAFKRCVFDYLMQVWMYSYRD